MPEQQQPPYNPYPPVAEPVKKQKNVIGLIAFVVAIVGFIFACIPGALIIGWILLPIAFILALVAIFLPQKAKGLAIGGLIISIVGTIVGFVVFFSVVVTSAADAFGGTESSVSESADEAAADDAADEAAEEPAESAEAGTRENPAPIGSTITGDDFTVVINSVNLDATADVLAANQFNDAPAEGNVYALVNATITYTGAESGFAAFVGFSFVAASGEVYDGTENLAVAPDPTLGLDELYTGGAVTGNVVVEIPAGGDGALRVRPGMLADEIFVSVK